MTRFLCLMTQLTVTRRGNNRPCHVVRSRGPPDTTIPTTFLAAATTHNLPSITNYALQTIALGNIQEVSSNNVSIQNRAQPTSGKCRSLMMGKPYGSSHRLPSSILPDRMRSLGTLPHSHTSNVFNLEMWAISAGAVSICCFLQLARWGGGSWALMSLTPSRS